jgi:hypothetical protein
VLGQTRHLPLGNYITELGQEYPVLCTLGRLECLAQFLHHSVERTIKGLDANAFEIWLNWAEFPALMVGIFLQFNIKRCSSWTKTGAVINDNAISSHRQD